MTGLRESSLQRILEKLEKLGWMERKITPSYSKEEPKGSIGFLLELKRKGDTIYVPKEALDEFKSEVKKLTRTKTVHNFRDPPNIEKQSYDDVLKSLNSRQRSMHEYNLPFRGGTKLWKKILQKHFPQTNYVFYRLIVFPYVVDQRNEGLIKDDKENMKKWHDIPKGEIDFWKQCRIDFSELKKFYNDIIPRTDLTHDNFQKYSKKIISKI